MSQSPEIAATMDGELVNSEKKECLPSSSHQTAATPKGEPRGKEVQDMKRVYWPQTAEVHIKGMISVSPGSCIFPFIK